MTLFSFLSFTLDIHITNPSFNLASVFYLSFTCFAFDSPSFYFGRLPLSFVRSQFYNTFINQSSILAYMYI